MSESEAFHPELHKNPREILKPFGEKFAVAWDAFHVSGNYSDLPDSIVDRAEIVEEKTDKKGKKVIEKTVTTTFNGEKFLQMLEKVNPRYLEHVKSMFDLGMEKVLKGKDQSRAGNETREKGFSDLMHSFVDKIEYFSRFYPPDRAPTGGRDRAQLEEASAQVNINIDPHARIMMHSETTTGEYGTFNTSKETKIIDFVCCKVKDMFRDEQEHNFKEIIDKANELGLELCESEDGPNYRLHYINQPVWERISIGMKQISGYDGYPQVFELYRDGNVLRLNGFWMDHGTQIHPNTKFIFRLPSPKPIPDKQGEVVAIEKIA